MGDFVPGGMYKIDHSGFRATDFAAPAVLLGCQVSERSKKLGHGQIQIRPQGVKTG
jgi:hypothetical protein